MTESLVDEAVRSRIRSELDRTLFVEAGAGTGKTHSLVDRVVALIASGIDISAIAAITFTEAAASELRTRVREAVEKKLADNPTADQRATLERALHGLDEAAIGTLHGFCLRLLTEHPLEVSIPPRVEVLDEVSSQIAFENRWAEFVEDLYADPTMTEVLRRAAFLNIVVEPRSPNQASFKDVARRFDDSWDRLGPFSQMPPFELRPVDVSAVRQAIDECAAMTGHCQDPDDKLLARIDAASQLGRLLDEADSDGLRLDRLQALAECKGSNSGQKLKWAGRVDDARAALTSIGEAAAAVVEQARTDVLRVMSHRLAVTTCAAAEQRRAEGRLVFHDLLVLANRLLRTDAYARTALAQRFQRLLLDEFQDTDPIQIEVAVLIAAVTVTDGAAWQEIDVSPGRLFFVGDPKQSIYRFRRADISLFLKARDTFAGADAVRLEQNFRTVPPVLDWVNHVFAQLIEETDQAQPGYYPLSPARSLPEGDHRVTLLGGPRDGTAGDVRQEEAETVAHIVATVGSEPDRWPVKRAEHEPGSGDWRPPRWSDVTILIPTRTSLRQLEDAFEDHGVPYRVATGSLIFDTQEVRDALSILAAIDDPADIISVVAALRSPMYACSDVDLFEYRAAGGRFRLREDRPAGVSDESPVVHGLAHLRAMAEQRWWTETSALLDRILRDRQAFLLAFSHRRPREVWRRLRYLVDQARAFEESGGGGTRSFLEWADNQRLEGTRVHEPMVAETDDDSVAIMTIHGAKGLEFPITVVSGCTTELARNWPGAQVLWNGDIPEVKLRKELTTADFDRLANIEAQMDVHERVRLLYVACTRAEDHLVVSSFHRVKVKSSFGRMVHDSSQDRLDELCRSYEVPDDPVAAPENLPAADPQPLAVDREQWIENRGQLLAKNRVPLFLSATAIAAAAAAAATGMETELPDESAGPWRRGRAGTSIGKAVHATLQLLDGSTDEERISALAFQHAHLEAVPDAVDTITALVHSALAAPSVQAAAAAPNVWRELYVAAPVGSRAVEGYIDLMYEAEGGLVLVDYKTDSIGSEADVDAKEGRYRLQLAAYALAVEEATGLTVTEARLVFCRAGGAVERVISDLAGAKEAVRSQMALS